MPTRAGSPTFLPQTVKFARVSSTMSSSTSSIATPRLLISLDASHPKAKAPTRGSAQAAGYDLYASEDSTIPKSGRAVVATGIRLAVPSGCYGRVAPRSGLALKHGIDTGAGVIDSDYRGLLGVILFNFGSEDFAVKPGDRIAQLILERIETPEVEVVEDLDETTRGAGGFGSTGGFGSVINGKDK
ncbi:hypothetical protein CBS101457_003527 [Exobasidium rhododendri]|nr:hypothetical protein CBS101457_003527 [Exobasidium rhododendri]